MTTETIDTTDLATWWHQRLGYPTQPKEIELHLSIFHSCDDTARYVTVPATHEGVALVRELIDAESETKGGTTVILRGLLVWETRYGTPRYHEDDVVLFKCKSVDDLLLKALKEVAARVNRGWWARVDAVPQLDADARENRAERKREAAERDRVAKLHAAGPDAIAALLRLLDWVEGVATDDQLDRRDGRDRLAEARRVLARAGTLAGEDEYAGDALAREIARKVNR